MALSVFVGDGFTITATIPGVPGLYPACRIKYRPIAQSVRAEYGEWLNTDPKTAPHRLVSRHVTEIQPDGGESFHITPEQCGQLHARLFQALLNAVEGFGPFNLADAEGNSPTPSASG